MKTLLILISIFITTHLAAQQDEYFVELTKKGDYRINCIDVNNDNSQLLLGGDNKTLAVFDLKAKKVIFETEAHYQPVVLVKFSDDGDSFYSIGDRSIKVWKTGAEKPEKIYTGPLTNITSCAFAQDEKNFVASSYDKKYRYWDNTELKATKTVETGHKKSIIAVALSSDNKLVATGSLDTSVEIWEVDNDKRKHLMLAHSRPISCLKFVNNNKHIISASHDGNARLWDVETGEPVKMYLGHKQPISSISVSPDGKHVLMGSFDNTVNLFNIATGERIHNYKHHEAPVLDVIWNKEGNGFYSCDKEGNVVCWSVPQKVFVDFYFGKEIDAELTESKLLLPRKKGESKDTYKLRLARGEKLKIELQEKYYQKYLDLQDKLVIGEQRKMGMDE